MPRILDLIFIFPNIWLTLRQGSCGLILPVPFDTGKMVVALRVLLAGRAMLGFQHCLRRIIRPSFT